MVLPASDTLLVAMGSESWQFQYLAHGMSTGKVERILLLVYVRGRKGTLCRGWRRIHTPRAWRMRRPVHEHGMGMRKLQGIAVGLIGGQAWEGRALLGQVQNRVEMCGDGLVSVSHHTQSCTKARSQPWLGTYALRTGA